MYEIHGDVGAAYNPGVVNDRDTEIIYPDPNPRGEPALPPEPDPTLEPPANDLPEVTRRRSTTRRSQTCLGHDRQRQLK